MDAPSELALDIPVSLSETTCMRPALRPPVNRRRLLTLGARLSVATFASAAIRPRSAASQSGLAEGYADGDGVRLHFVREGEGELMMFLHGVEDTSTLYMNQLTEFGRDHMVVAPDLRGFPPSDQPDAVDAYAMPRLLGDVHALLRHFGRERCILVGNDWGGYIAWVFASAYPSRVERLIILNAPHPAIFLREVRHSAAQIQASQYERDYDSAIAPYPSWYNYYRADPIKIPSSLAEAAHTQMPDLAARFFADVAEPPATTSLRVDVPTLVLWGMQDPVCLPGQLDNLRDYASNAIVVRIEDGGHRPMQSHQGLVNQAIRDFLRHTHH
jgi:pimeloyl-ACP methyl ester carboxylesterase